MEKENLNCWEHKGYGKESSRRNIFAQEACHAAIDERADGIQNGKNGGRYCWVVTPSHRTDVTFWCYTGESVTCR